MLGAWSDADGALSQRLAGAVQRAIQRGDLSSNTRLPPERELAAVLSVGRATVAAAYRSLLRAEVIDRRQGSGSWVRTAAPSRATGELASRSPHRLSSLVGAEEKGTLNLQPASFGVPPGSEGLFAEATAELARVAHEHGYNPQGYQPLRSAIARRLSERGVGTSADDILITTGAQQAIALSAVTLVRSGDFVVLEDPTFPGAIDAYQYVGARVLPVAVRPTGIDVEAAAEAMGRVAVRLAYITPSFQNPTGTVMPLDARRYLAAIAERNDVIVLEDDTFGELAFATDPLPPLAAFDPDGRVILGGSLSKIFWGGLRVGWVRASRALLGRLAHTKGVLDLASSLPSQILATAVLRHGGELRKRRLEEARVGLQTLEALMGKHLPAWTYAAPSGGLVLWARLPHGSATDLARIARQHGVAILPGTEVSASGGGDDRVRIPFTLPRRDLSDAIARLGRAWSAYDRSTTLRSRVVV